MVNMGISVKISEDNYRMLCSLSGRLQEKQGKTVTINDAISHLSKKGKLSDLAGSWKMTDKEVEEMFSGLQKGWKNWSIKFA
ncbi:hypothetical protein HZB01_01795 [Candidatus Woesearchaeota archaeon]|nr:hypothetical protein [Candidatus Woesearchaeota archaeon]